jgi:hypothetical protein
VAPCVQVKQAIAREAAKGHMKWEAAVLDALKLTRDDVTSLSEEEAQVCFFAPDPPSTPAHRACAPTTTRVATSAGWHVCEVEGPRTVPPEGGDGESTMRALGERD